MASSLKSIASLRTQGGSENSCGEQDAVYRGKLFSEVAAHINKQRNLGRSLGPGEMPSQMQNAVWAAERAGWLREVIEIKHPDGTWRRPQKSKPHTSKSRKRSIQKLHEVVKQRMSQCKRLKVQTDNRYKAKQAHLEKLKKESAKVKAKLAKLQTEMVTTEKDIDVVKQEQEVWSKEIEMSDMLKQAAGVCSKNQGLTNAVEKLTKDNAKVIRQVQELKEKVAAQELLRLK